ncbi:Uncharacterised protein [Bacteroides heparinolyticus]|uniref:Uncharacterized protein n=1 Tax=Prevotella heparinolytica TaxID=28113 RepID=A0A449I6T4_9BACE|nr:Uncharacterised protein [Bacteroides heparinolyticus]
MYYRDLPLAKRCGRKGQSGRRKALQTGGTSRSDGGESGRASKERRSDAQAKGGEWKRVWGYSDMGTL